MELESFKIEYANAQLECNAADERAKLLASEVIGLEEKVAYLHYIFLFKFFFVLFLYLNFMPMLGLLDSHCPSLWRWMVIYCISTWGLQKNYVFPLILSNTMVYFLSQEKERRKKERGA